MILRFLILDVLIVTLITVCVSEEEFQIKFNFTQSIFAISFSEGTNNFATIWRLDSLGYTLKPCLHILGSETCEDFAVPIPVSYFFTKRIFQKYDSNLKVLVYIFQQDATDYIDVCVKKVQQDSQPNYESIYCFQIKYQGDTVLQSYSFLDFEKQQSHFYIYLELFHDKISIRKYTIVKQQNNSELIFSYTELKLISLPLFQNHYMLYVQAKPSELLIVQYKQIPNLKQQIFFKTYNEKFQLIEHKSFEYPTGNKSSFGYQELVYICSNEQIDKFIWNSSIKKSQTFIKSSSQPCKTTSKQKNLFYLQKQKGLIHQVLMNNIQQIKMSWVIPAGISRDYITLTTFGDEIWIWAIEFESVYVSTKKIEKIVQNEQDFPIQQIVNEESINCSQNCMYCESKTKTCLKCDQIHFLDNENNCKKSIISQLGTFFFSAMNMLRLGLELQLRKFLTQTFVISIGCLDKTNQFIIFIFFPRQL